LRLVGLGLLWLELLFVSLWPGVFLLLRRAEMLRRGTGPATLGRGKRSGSRCFRFGRCAWYVFHDDGAYAGGFVARLNLFQAIEYAYFAGDPGTWGMKGNLIQNLPDWASGMNLYDVSARVPEEDMAEWRNQGNRHELLHSALQAALKERCKMVVHEQPTMVPDYQLVIAKKGLRLKASVPGAALPKGDTLQSGGVRVGERLPNKGARWRYYGATIGDLVDFLSVTSSGRSIHDMTGLTGHYDFTLEMIGETSNDPDMTVFNWPVDQLGLVLKPGKEAGFTLAVDHIERPTPN
jgi:uncharacterized protein (TIGR03435 family)